jgi:hypothetical protein
MYENSISYDTLNTIIPQHKIVQENRKKEKKQPIVSTCQEIKQILKDVKHFNTNGIKFFIRN